MNKKQNNTSLLVGGICIFATIVIYLLSIRNIFEEPMCWLALSCIVFSELITLYLACTSKENPARETAVVVGIVQTLITIVISVYFINVAIFSYTGFIISYVITFTVALILIVVLTRFYHDRAVENKEFKDAKMNMVQIRSVVQSMINSGKGADYIDSLKALDENLRFSDDSTIHGLDSEIFNRVRALSSALQSGGTNIEESIEKINGMIAQRNFLVKNEKSYK